MSRLRLLLTAACATGLLIGNPAFAQDQVVDEDWDYAEDVAKKTYIATVTFASGQELQVQCYFDRFVVSLWGLPDRANALHGDRASRLYARHSSVETEWGVAEHRTGTRCTRTAQWRNPTSIISRDSPTSGHLFPSRTAFPTCQSG